MTERRVNGLDVDRLVIAAFEALEEDGLDKLSMRRLATRLGVQAPAIYWHVENKAVLLGLMARQIYAAAYDEVAVVENWTEWLTQFGHSLRREFAKYRDGARLCAMAEPMPETDPEEHAQKIAASLSALGLSQKKALSYQASVISFSLGWATFEANGRMHHLLESMMDIDDSFCAGLAAMVKGFSELEEDAH